MGPMFTQFDPATCVIIITIIIIVKKMGLIVKKLLVNM